MHHAVSLFVPFGTASSLACYTSVSDMGGAKRVDGNGLGSSSELSPKPIGAMVSSSLILSSE